MPSARSRPEAAVGSDVTVVMPTYRRPVMCSEKARWIIDTWHPAALVVVVDGSGDETARLVREAAPTATLVELPVNVGMTAACNRGIEAVLTSWTLRVDDDDLHPADYADVLLREALTNDADVVAAPWLHCGDEPIDQFVSRLRSTRQVPSLHTPTSRFPPEPGLVTAFMPANMLGRTDVFRQLPFDEGLRGNAWREETDFYLRCAEAGFRTWFTPHTYSWIEHRSGGGQRARGRLSYELHTQRNHIRFLRRHRSALGLDTTWDVMREAGGFGYSRLQPIGMAAVRKAVRKLREKT